ncbi:polysaccharide biosynthesis/export family protein [Flavobacterium sp. SM15]|nr:polysaccharide biosynthesis/export family protein [Flavobacterium sp. SM15]MCG2611298.1 polysaccharide biosynthesis/export family protein [Flavobacterium sp. SM15]
MRKGLFLLMLFIGISTISCVPQKDLIYLQNAKQDSLSVAVNPVVNKPYRVQTNDILHIKIKALDQRLVDMFSSSSQQGMAPSEQSLYFDGYTVDDHGNIKIPVLGEINVLGYTTEEIRAKVEKQLLEDYFKKEANIFITVKLAGLRFTVNGEVKNPGTKTLYQEKATILDAIANSGDIDIVGNRKEVLLVRQYPHGTEMHTLDLTDAKVMQSPYYYLQPNDYIYVKPLKQKSWGTGSTGTQSIATIVTALSLVASTMLLLKNL